MKRFVLAHNINVKLKNREIRGEGKNKYWKMENRVDYIIINYMINHIIYYK